MKNELVKVEDGKVVIAENIIKEINKFQKAKLKMDVMQEELKENLKIAMEKVGADKYISPDGTIVVNYFPERTSKRFSSTKLKKEKPELYEEYLEDSITKAYVKLTVK